MTFLRALRCRAFALLWLGQTISRLGDHLHRVALAWWVLQHTGSAVVMGTVLIFASAPTLLLLLVGGVMVDRWPRVPLMVLSDVLRALVIGSIALLAWTDTLAVWHLYGFSLIFGLVDAFFQPAYRAAVPEITPIELLPSANALTSLSQSMSGIVGPAFGAGIVALGGTAWAFALDALSFVLAALCLLPLLKLSKLSYAPRTTTTNLLADVRVGLATVLGTPWLWITIGIAGLSNIAYGAPMGVALPFLISDHLHAHVATLGLFYSCSSLGSVLGAVWFGRATVIARRGITLYGAWMLVGIMVTLSGLSVSLPIVLVAALVIGIANTVLGLIWVGTVQELVPRDLQGRVFSIDHLGSSLLEPAGYAIGGWATALLGPALVFIIGGAVQSSLIALGLLHPNIRSLD